MKKILLLILLLVASIVPSCATAGQATASWELSIDDPYLGANGGYRIYVGTTSGNYTQKFTVAPGVSTAMITLKPGTYYAALTAYDSDGLESDKTAEITFTVVIGKPGSFRVK